MRLSVEHPLIQTQEPRLTKYQVKVLQRLGHPEALALIQFLTRVLNR